MPSNLLLATATAAKSGSKVTATVNGIDTSVQVSRDVPVAVGDVLMVQKVGSQWFCTGRFYTAAPAAVTAAPPPPPKPATVTGKLVCSAIYTGSYRDGKWRTDTSDVVQGSYGGSGNSTGAAYYGSKPRTLAGSTVTDCWITVRRGSGGAYSAQQTTLRLLGESTRPAGYPSLGSGNAGPTIPTNSTLSHFDIPNSWGQAIVDGSAGGIGIYDSSGSPYVRFVGRSDYSSSFTLTLSWKR